MTSDSRFLSPHFPRAAKYHPDWIAASASGGANSLWLTEWLANGLRLQPGMRVLDLGCGLAASSIFLHREFGVEVWATDLWFSASDNQKRIRDAAARTACAQSTPTRVRCHSRTEFFDAIVSIDSFFYYGTDDLYLNYLALSSSPAGKSASPGPG